MTDITIKFTLPGGEKFELPAYHDEHGVLRYYGNAVIEEAFEDRLIDLNAIAVMKHRNNTPLKDVIIFWSMLGYSVDGMCDLSFMSKVRVETPNWVSEPEEEED